MAQAIFGLIGVIVGAVVTGLVEWWQARRTSANLRRAAARLVQDELVTAVGVITVALRDAQRAAATIREAVTQEAYISTAMWREYRPVLAEALTLGAWNEISL